LVVHRFWKSLGFTMPKVLAWFITFNFVNIAWVFFRAKEWEDAIKVLAAMFTLDNVVLSKKYFNFSTPFQELNIHFGLVYQDIQGKSLTTTMLILAFIIIFLKNSHYYREHPRYNYLSLLVTIGLFIASFSLFSHISEFLYFNF